MAEEYRNRKFIAKDFDTFRSLLLEYARTYYPDKISDFSESSMGGVFLDFASYVGDVLSFYMDHQFLELDPEQAVESQNIEKLLRNSGIKITGAAPASVKCKLIVRVPAVITTSGQFASEDALPIIQEGTIVSARNGVKFRLLEDVDFTNSTERTITIHPNGNSYFVTKIGTFLSGNEVSEEISIGNFEAFKTITLENSNVTKILSVTDSNGNDYYEVNTLTEEIVYKNIKLIDPDSNIRETIKIVPAPYRYVSSVDLLDRKTTLTFGGGSATNFEDDVIPDPSDFALTLYGTSTFSRDLINPSSFINKRTLGVVDENSTITIRYMYGGGLSHNVGIRDIDTVILLKINFPNNPEPRVVNSVRNSLNVTNEQFAIGGAEALSIESYKSLINQLRNAQARIVTKEDLLARIYSMPTNFGRIFKANVVKDEKNSLITKLYVICKHSDNTLIKATDHLKKNLINLLESFRMISDVIEIYDSDIVNYSIKCNITVDPTYKKESVVEQVKNNLLTLLDINKFDINQPINVSDIRNRIYSTNGVVTVSGLEIYNRSGTFNNRNYTGIFYDMQRNRINDLIFPTIGGIFELKHKKNDIDIYAN